jgi:hypothetical protein
MQIRIIQNDVGKHEDKRLCRLSVSIRDDALSAFIGRVTTANLVTENAFGITISETLGEITLTSPLQVLHNYLTFQEVYLLMPDTDDFEM